MKNNFATNKPKKLLCLCRQRQCFCRMAIFSLVCFVAIIARCGLLVAEDWPTYRHDNHRSGITSEVLNAEYLQEIWVYRSPHPPQPAWAGPAKWDAYRNMRGLRSMRNYDPVFHVIVVGDSLYSGSSAEDCVYCLNTETGAEKWVYFTGGPVRIPPAFYEGKIYFGSDDGNVYCLKEDDGSLQWKYKPSPGVRMIPSNGKMISIWPCRTGVLVRDGIAYFAAALLPWRDSYLCAVDAGTGSDVGPGLYKQTLDKVTMEGALLASATKLYVPQGRVPPMVFDRATGAHLGNVGGGGGVFALITSDSRFFHGPGNKTGWIVESNADTRDKVAQLNQGNVMVVTEAVAYLLTDDALSAINRSNQEKIWSVSCRFPYELILAGNVLFAGGDYEVAAFDAKTGGKIWTEKVAGKAYGIAVANGKLFVSTSTGTIHAFK